MHIGVAMFATDYAISIDELARETEARGFESLWVPEHTHIPTSRRTPWPGGNELPLESAILNFAFSRYQATIVAQGPGA
jgi:alkanesulfonate monooxygenase SsuD/methylene tetrahydromethanopterin reductase-like flavin-dependent oxidoreductase (luciferase family)